jgi:host factor-I protein
MNHVASISTQMRRSAMESKPAQNIQDTFLNTVRKDKSPITIYLVSGVKLTGKIRSFDKYSVLLENNSQEQLIFKHAISTVVSGRAGSHVELRSDSRSEGRSEVRPEPRAHVGNSASIHHAPAEIVAAAAE